MIMAISFTSKISIWNLIIFFGKTECSSKEMETLLTWYILLYLVTYRLCSLEPVGKSD